MPNESGRGVAVKGHAVVIAGGGPTGLMLAAELALARDGFNDLAHAAAGCHQRMPRRSMPLGLIEDGIRSRKRTCVKRSKGSKALDRMRRLHPPPLYHQKPGHGGHEGNRAGLLVRFVLAHDTVFLHASIAAPEGHRAAKDNGVG